MCSDRVPGGASQVHVESLDDPIAANHLHDIALAVAEVVAIDVRAGDQRVALFADGISSTVAE
ncbi:MAG: hypothetical protein OES46_15785 [Gammaproteobacteria bacterium]|nr:hypothetical protein [Gammaproteobacteria bacterium]